MKQISILLAFFLITNLLIGQVVVEWGKRYGGSGTDELKAMHLMENGNLILGGFSTSNDGDFAESTDNNYWLMEIDPLGNILWKKNYVDYYLSELELTNDGGFLLGGTRFVGGYNGQDYLVIKLNSVGDIEWEKVYGIENERDYLKALQSTNDGGFIVGGYTEIYNTSLNYDLTKFDNLGNIEWTHSYGGSKDDELQVVRQTNDGGFILGGYTTSNDEDISQNYGSVDYWVVKIDNLGNLEWEQNYGGSNFDLLLDLRQTNDNGFILGGSSASNDGDINNSNLGSDYWIVKIDSLGNIEWEQSYGGNHFDHFTTLLETSDNNFIIGGHSASADIDVSGNNGADDYWIVKIDATGNLIWEQHFGGSNDDITICIQEDNEGNFIVGGYSYNEYLDIDFYVIKIREVNQKIIAQPFYDENGNNILDQEEQSLYNLPFTINPITAITNNADGATTYYVDPDTYTLQYDYTSNNLWTINNVPSSYTIEITEPVDTTFYFPMQPITDFLIQNVDITSSITRCNQNTNVWLTYTNNSSESTSGYVNLVANDLATFISATPPVDSIAGDTLYWFYENLYPTHSEQIKAIFEMSGVGTDGENLGENIVFDTQIETWEGDGNNKGYLSSELICAYDPNDKLVTPTGVQDENYTLFEDSLFNYTIRFQNTGNDTAFNIIIKDTLSNYLNIETYQFIASSHEVNTRINESERIIEF